MTDSAGENRPVMTDWLARMAMELCCAAYQVSIHEMLLNGRSRASAAYARQVAMYLAHVVGRLTMGDVSAAFQRDRTTVAHACRVIEDRRDSPVFDRQIEELSVAYREQIERRTLTDLRDGGESAADSADSRRQRS